MEACYHFIEAHVLCKPFFASILAGFSSSFVFIFALLFLFRPWILISPKISVLKPQAKSGGPDTETTFYIKVINRSHFSAFDVKVELSLRTPVNGVEGSQNYRDTAIKLVKSEYPYIPRFIPRWCSPSYTEYATWFSTTEPLQEKMEENQSSTLELKVICKHALTGLGKVTRKKYSVRDIKYGMYKSGNTFEIV